LAKSTDFVLSSSGCQADESWQKKGVIGRSSGDALMAPGELEAAF
jgi:hypothetical protein